MKYSSSTYNRPSGPPKQKAGDAVLTGDETADCDVINADGPSKFVFLCDHASPAIPKALHDLGLSDEERLSHIGWDIGAAKITRLLAEQMNATAILSRYSRLVVDCNRMPATSQSIVQKSDNIRIIGNELLSDERARARADACFWPYHNKITEILDKRHNDRRPTVLVSMHSFTPQMNGEKRPWEIGFLYGRDDSLARLLMDWLKAERPDLHIGDNEPYQVRTGVDYTVPVHGEARGLYAVLIELRNDEINNQIGLEFWSAMLSTALAAVENQLKFNHLRTR